MRTTKLIWYSPEQRKCLREIVEKRQLPSENAAIREAIDDYITLHLPDGIVDDAAESTITHPVQNDDDSDSERCCVA